jgi:SAM-dependent methyltransferase
MIRTLEDPVSIFEPVYECIGATVPSMTNALQEPRVTSSASRAVSVAQMLECSEMFPSDRTPANPNEHGQTVGRIDVDNWDQHWTEYGEAAEMGPTPRYRRAIVFDLLGALPTDARFLDIGSGTGEFAEEFHRRNPKVSYLGLELSAAGVHASQRRVPGVQFLQRNLLEDQPAVPFQATHALCSEVLEHLEDPARLLRNAYPYMADGCRIVVTVPGGVKHAFYEEIGHRKHYSATELRALLESAGLEVELATGMGFPFFDVFQMLIRLRGNALKGDITGKPSLLVRVGSVVFNTLFRFNSRSSGWQTVAVARLRRG